MTTTTASSEAPGRGLGLSQALRLPALLWLVLAAAILLAYGYEIFNFHLTIDEELHAAAGIGRRDWIAQGRWGMALVATVLLRTPVGPVVSTFIGVIGTAIGLVLALRWTLRLDERATVAVAALAVTTPTLAFIFTFGTIAYGVGVAFIAVALSVRCASAHTVRGALLACALGAFAIGIYQPFVLNIAMLAAIHAARDMQGPRAALLRRYAYWLAYVAASFVVYALVSAATVAMHSIDVQYLTKFIDLAGLWSEPLARLAATFGALGSVLALDPQVFGATSPWLAVTLAAAVASLVLVPLRNGIRGRFAMNVASLLLVAGVLVLAGVVSGEAVPLRSMVYLPLAIAVVAAMGCADAARPVRAALFTLCFLAVVGNAMIANHLFASAADAEFQDRLVASDVMKYVRSLDPALVDDRRPMKIETIGALVRPETPLRHARDTFGASFFQWDGGNRMRVAAYLRLNGLNATWNMMPANGARSNEVGKTMPAWPREGWVRFSPPDLLVLKFGDYTPSQAAGLCAWGIQALCKPLR